METALRVTERGAGAFIVVDLGFGDAGKGLVTDYLVRRHGARIVVRFNGGAQAGHNVITEHGRHHTFSQFGAGTFVPRVRTHLAREVVVHPTALALEAEVLARAGEHDVLERLSVDPECRVTTPFQQAAGRLRELLRGGERHGSCGVGLGETVRDALERPELTLRIRDLATPGRARERLFAQRDLKFGEFRDHLGSTSNPRVAREIQILTGSGVCERWLSIAAEVVRRIAVVEDEACDDLGAPMVFEGAQGVLLDERFGFHPFTTYSRTTFDGAHDVLERFRKRGPVERLGVLRTYLVRHGPGPLPTEDPGVVERTVEAHNGEGPWQGRVRKGWLDLVLLRYALRACGGVDRLVLTHLDALAAFAGYRICESYGGLERLELPANLGDQERLTRLVGSAEPRYARLGGERGVDSAEFCDALESLAGVPVAYASDGPRAACVVERHASAERIGKPVLKLPR